MGENKMKPKPKSKKRSNCHMFQVPVKDPRRITKQFFTFSLAEDAEAGTTFRIEALVTETAFCQFIVYEPPIATSKVKDA